jgi:hypothetical protein
LTPTPPIRPKLNSASQSNAFHCCFLVFESRDELSAFCRLLQNEAGCLEAVAEVVPRVAHLTRRKGMALQAAKFAEEKQIMTTPERCVMLNFVFNACVVAAKGFPSFYNDHSLRTLEEGPAMMTRGPVADGRIYHVDVLFKQSGTGFTNISTIFLTFFHLFSKSLLNCF